MDILVARLEKDKGTVTASHYRGRGRPRTEVHRLLGYQAVRYPDQYLLIVSPPQDCGGASSHDELLQMAVKADVLRQKDGVLSSSDDEELTLIAAATIHEALTQWRLESPSSNFFLTPKPRRWLVARALGHMPFL